MATIHPRPKAVATDYFRPLDYLVFTAMLVISAFIGMYYAYKGVHKSHKDYLMGGRQLTCGPVALSLTASFMSAVTVLGTPAEVYRFGAMFGLFAFSYTLMVVITAEVFLPIYYRLQITSAYELMPYLVLDILGDFPGVPGLFVAGTYSGTLSTVSSSINALAAVTVEDIVKPHFTTLTDAQLAWISMAMNILFGGVCLIMAGLASFMGGLLQAALSIFGIVGGPLFGLFSLGILFPFGNAKGAFSGLLSGFVVGMWIGIGSHFYRPPPHRTMELTYSTAGCAKFNLTTTTPFTTLPTTPTPPRLHIHDNWYSMSYLYFSTMATLFTVVVGVIVSLSTGGLNQEVDRRLLFGKEELLSNYMFLKAKFGAPVEKIHPAEEESPE